MMEGMDSKKMDKGKNHKINSEPKIMKDMPIMDIDEEMGNMKGMCEMVAKKS